MDSDSSETMVRVARIGKPHGIRGEVTVQVFTDSPESRFREGSSLSIRMPKNSSIYFQTLTIERNRWNKKILVLKFVEVSDRNTAESLRDSELYAEIVHPDENGEGWYADDLVGLAVYEGSLNSPKIGEVTNLITGEAQDLIEIRLSDGREVLVPFVEEIVPVIDEEHGAVVITPPPGLLELNQD